MVALLSFTDIIYRWNILKYLFNCLTICSGQWVAGRTICRPVVTCVSSQAASQPVPSLFKNRLHSWPVLVAWSSRCSTCTCRGRVTGASEQQRAAGTGAAGSWAQNFHLRRACFRQTATTTTYLPTYHSSYSPPLNFISEMRDSIQLHLCSSVLLFWPGGLSFVFRKGPTSSHSHGLRFFTQESKILHDFCFSVVLCNSARGPLHVKKGQIEKQAKQCDQIGRYLSVLGTNFLKKRIPNVCWLFGLFWKDPFSF